MPRLTIDGRIVEVSAGTKVIEAAEQIGIFIPRLCYHPALGSVGACRLCAVSFVDGPLRGVQMSCMVEAQDGMVVSTTDSEAADLRRHVIEWLMANHPHDCPVCDEGGHCLLQEVTVSGGHGARRFPGRKRTYRDQDLGPHVQHEMNRCIHCYRCRRFYQDFAGGRDLGALGIASRTFFGRAESGPLESPFSGNLIDLCPTGVFTDKVSRYKGRRWDFQRAPSVCTGCSLGCNTVVSARYREVVRVEARVNEEVNGHFLCDRGRFGFGYANRPDRPRTAKLAGRAVSMEEALAAAASALSGAPPGAVACVGSSGSSLETASSLTRLCQILGWAPPGFFAREAVARRTAEAVGALAPELAVSLRKVEEADLVLLVDTAPLEEGPMAAFWLRQAFRRGAKVLSLGLEAGALPLPVEPIPAGTDEIEDFLARLAEAFVPDGHPAPLPPHLARIRGRLSASRRPLFLCGTERTAEGVPARVAALARVLREGGREAGLFFLLAGANAFAAAGLSADGRPLETVVRAAEAGEVAALVLVESDSDDAELLERAVKAVPFSVALGHRASPAAERATVFLPTVTVFEAGGWYVNQEGRRQFAEAAHAGGTPIAQTGDGDHPPRSFRPDIPGGEPRPAWQLLDALGALTTPARAAELEEDPLRWLARLLPSDAAPLEWAARLSP